MADPRRTPAEVRRSGDVPALPHQVKLAGSPRALAWPSICAACGSPASGRLPVTRVFDRDWRYRRRDVGDVRIHAVRTIHVPFCGVCAVEHRRLAQPLGIVRGVLSVFATVYVIPLAIASAAVAFYFFPPLLAGADAIVAAPRTAWQASAFGLAVAAFALLMWYQTRRLRVTASTVITASFDFSDNLGGLAGIEHRVYGMTNATFADAFAKANAERVWTDELGARSARRQAVAAAVVAGAVLVALAIAMSR